MRFEKLTTQFQEALGEAQSLAVAQDNPYIEPLHLLAAMLRQDGPKALLGRAGANVSGMAAAVQAAIGRLPQVQGNEGNIQISRELNNLLNLTEKEATKRGDQFIPSEMFLLAVADDKGDAGRLARDNGLSRKSLETAIDAVRGGQNVTSADAEQQREALNKYTLDLTERARSGKLDPVIGRDDEIRR
ncbi:MAG: Clp protease N-terminal domain-containing protein, partial [Thiomonas delicata]